MYNSLNTNTTLLEDTTKREDSGGKGSAAAPGAGRAARTKLANIGSGYEFRKTFQIFIQKVHFLPTSKLFACKSA